MARVGGNAGGGWDGLGGVMVGWGNQGGEDNRNVAGVAALLGGLPERVPGATVNRLCASGLEAVGSVARAIRSGEMDFAIAGGGESMTRAPLGTAQAQAPFPPSAEIFHPTMGLRFLNPLTTAQ